MSPAAPPGDRLRLYSDLAGWFHLFTHPASYAPEAARYAAVLMDAGLPKGGSVLELGCGGGNNASHLKRDFVLTLTDRSQAMLAVSRALNPECEHVQGDMTSLRLGRTFDAVFVHDAVSYLTTDADLAGCLRTAFEHCAPGAPALFVPDFLRETLRLGVKRSGHDGPDGRALRYLEWFSDPDPSDDTYVVDFAFMMRDAPDADVRVVHERHVFGALARGTWDRLAAEAGFTGTRWLPSVDDGEGNVGQMLLALRPR